MKSVLALAVYLLLASPIYLAQGQQSTYDPAARYPAKHRDSFIDFALKQVNPQNIDYGCRIDQARKLALDKTVKNIDAWAALVALIFLVFSFFMMLHQHRERNRREVIAAEFLAQYHNAWVDAHQQAAEAIRRHNELVHTTNTGAEAGLRSSLPSETRRDAKAQLALTGAARSNVKMSQVDVIAQISGLQQQLTASQEREKNLEKELSKVQRSGAGKQSVNASPGG